MRVRWFGAPWPTAEERAPICDLDAWRVETPVGKPCIWCPDPIREHERGVVLASFADDDRSFTMEIREQEAVEGGAATAISLGEWVDGPGVIVREERRTVCASHIDCLVRHTSGLGIAALAAPPRVTPPATILTLDRLERELPMVEWRKPARVFSLHGTAFACRVCTAVLGLHANGLPQSWEEYADHFRTAHDAEPDPPDPE